MKNGTKWTLALLALVAVAAFGSLYRGHAEPAFAAEGSRSTVAGDAPVVTVYKNPTCACCAEWADHLSATSPCPAWQATSCTRAAATPCSTK